MGLSLYREKNLNQEKKTLIRFLSNEISVYIQVGAAKKILAALLKRVMIKSSIRGDMGLESLKGRRDRCKRKWWYKE